MKRSAFTMIELIFVIVILGILAAVAMPRLAATRDDAKVSALVYGVSTGIHEIAVFAASKGETNTSFSLMSNNFAMLQANGDANLSADKAMIKGGKTNDCIMVDINRTSTEDILQVTENNTTTDSLCLALQEMIHSEDYPLKLRGISVQK